jgi:cobalt/nickel transport system permease protein
LKHSFIDKYSELDSPVHQLDARLRLLAAFATILIIVSVPRGYLQPFIPFSILIFVVILISRVPLHFFLSRCLIISPFVIFAAAFYPVSAIITDDYIDYGRLHPEVMVALSVISKAFLSVIMLTLLVSTGKFNDLLKGMRQLRMPKLIGMLSALMYRYVFIIYDEALRTNRARDSRTPGRLRNGRFKVYGNQAAMIFLRSWERSQVVYHAMLSRGFNGEFPGHDHERMNPAASLFVALFILLFLACRIYF